jgi:hypothetical protein
MLVFAHFRSSRSVDSGLRRAIMGHMGGLESSPPVADNLEVAGAF